MWVGGQKIGWGGNTQKGWWDTIFCSGIGCGVTYKQARLYSVPKQKWGLRKSLNFALFLPFKGLFIHFFLLHLNTTYKSREMSGHTRLEVPF